MTPRQWLVVSLGIMAAAVAAPPQAIPGQLNNPEESAGMAPCAPGVFLPARRFGGGGGDIGSYANRTALGITYERMPVNVSSNDLTNPANIDFSDADMKVGLAQSNGIRKFGIIAYNGSSGFWPPATNLGPVVARYVERYDGDGADDMPGLTIPIQHWEIFNEYTTNWADYTGCSEAMYARYLSNAYVAAHAANTGIIVVASAVATARNSRNNWYLTKFLTNTWVTNYFDAMNYHAYEDFYPFTNGANVQADYLFIRDFKDFLAGYGLADRELWSTETDFSGTYMNEGQTASQTDNARYLARSYPFALACGVNHVFFTELEYNSHFPAHLNWAVLSDSSGNRRPVFYVYQKMIEKLEGFTQANLEDYGNANIGAKFIVNNQPVWVVWNYSNRTSQASIPVGTGSYVRITQALPATCNNTSSTWTITTNAVTGGYAVIDTGSNAVYVEISAPATYLDPPQNLSASKGTYTDKVRIAWSGVANATGYEVFRSASSSTSDAAAIAASSTTNYDDTSATAGQLFYYWVKATNAYGSSAFSSSDYGWGANISAGVCADYDGDGKADPAIYDETTGTWKIKLSSAQYHLLTTTFNGLGVPGYASVAADYDGDNKADPAVYHELTGRWIILPSSVNYTAPIILVQPLGGVGYSGMPADYDGDQRADPGVYLPAVPSAQPMQAGQRERGDWKVLLSSADYYPVEAPGLLGGTGYRAVAADYDGDQKADPAVYGESNGYWIFRLSSIGYVEIALTQTLGGTGYTPVPADYDGDGFTDPAVKSEIGNEWIVMLSSGHYAPVHLTILFE